MFGIKITIEKREGNKKPSRKEIRNEIINDFILIISALILILSVYNMIYFNEYMEFRGWAFSIVIAAITTVLCAWTARNLIKDLTTL